MNVSSLNGGKSGMVKAKIKTNNTYFYFLFIYIADNYFMADS